MIADIASGCVEWQGSRNAKGYGLVKVDGRNARVHRAVWEALCGPIPEGMLVCHRCDNPSCYRIDHLFLGTPEDNMRDMVAKCRGRRGWTQCRHGHPLSGDNLYEHDGKRLCKECRRTAVRRHRSKEPA